MIKSHIFGLVFLISSFAFAGDGRFQLIQLGEMRRDQFLLDTQTGRVWNRICGQSQSGSSNVTPNDCIENVWVEETVRQKEPQMRSKKQKSFTTEELFGSEKK